MTFCDCIHHCNKACTKQSTCMHTVVIIELQVGMHCPEQKAVVTLMFPMICQDTSSIMCLQLYRLPKAHYPHGLKMFKGLNHNALTGS